MSLFSNITNMIKGVLSGIKKIPISDLILNILGYIPAILIDIQKVVGMKKDGFNNEEQFQLVQSALEEFDLLTGETGSNLIHDMPVEKEEETLDCLKKVIENMAGYKLKIDGYYNNDKNTAGNNESITNA